MESNTSGRCDARHTDAGYALLLLCWLAAAGAAQAAWLLTPWTALVPAVLAALVVPAVAGRGRRTRASAAMLMLTAAAVPVAPLAAWIVAAVAAVAVLSAPRSVRAGDDLAELRRHIERSRRAGESAHVFVASVPHAPDRRAQDVVAAFRVADSVQVLRRPGGDAVRGVVSDASDFRPEGMQARLHRVLGPQTAVGWARFPDAGATLDLLLERAEADMAGAADAPGKRPAPATLPVLVRTGK